MPKRVTPRPKHLQRLVRLEARISRDQKALFKKAAALEGRTLTDFVIDCVGREAQKIIQQHKIIKLSERDRRVFVKALLNPPAPNKALLKAVTLHARQVGDEP